jgi:ATP-binding protein involved in chromosome partitioning
MENYFEMAKNTNDGVLSTDAVMKALSTVIEPELHKDLVTLNMIRDLAVSGGAVSFMVMLTTPACPLKDVMERDCRRALMQVPGVESISIKWGSSVPVDNRIIGQLSLPVKTTVAIASGKGGVGKSTVAVNVAVALARAGASVGLLDADIYGPNTNIMLGAHRMPPPIEENGVQKMMPAVAHGVKLMSMGFLVKPNQPLVWRGPMLHSAIRQFLSDVAWGNLDYLIIDLPPGTGDAQLTLTQSVPLTGGVIVTLPQEVSQADALRGLMMFRQMDVPFIGEIPIDPQVRVGGDSGEPIVVSHPESAAAKALTAIANDIAAKVSVQVSRQSNLIPIQMIE